MSEVINIELTDFDLDSKELIVRNGKGDKERVVFFNTKVKNAIIELLKVRKPRGNYLFNTRQSDKMSRSAVEKLFDKHSDILTPHQERHNFGSSKLCNYGVQQNSSGNKEDENMAKYTLAEIQFLLGHSSIKSTQVYLNPSIKAMKEKAEMNI